MLLLRQTTVLDIVKQWHWQFAVRSTRLALWFSFSIQMDQWIEFTFNEHFSFYKMTLFTANDTYPIAIYRRKWRSKQNQMSSSTNFYVSTFDTTVCQTSDDTENNATTIKRNIKRDQKFKWFVLFSKLWCCDVRYST